MSTARRLLGAATPDADTDTELLEVIGPGSLVISSIFICNRNTTDIKFQLWIVAHNDVAPPRFLYFNRLLGGLETFKVTGGITPGSAGTSATGDTLNVRSDTANVDFTVFGEAAI